MQHWQFQYCYCFYYSNQLYPRELLLKPLPKFWNFQNFRATFGLKLDSFSYSLYLVNRRAQLYYCYCWQFCYFYYWYRASCLIRAISFAIERPHDARNVDPAMRKNHQLYEQLVDLNHRTYYNIDSRCLSSYWMVAISSSTYFCSLLSSEHQILYLSGFTTFGACASTY